MKRLEGNIAIITGGGRGIGAATALLFAQQGAKVVISSRTESELHEVAKTINDKTGEGSALAVTADVTNETDVIRLFQTALDHFGPVDILINNAGAIVVKPVDETSYDEWKLQQKVNLDGTFLCTREAFQQMKKTKKGGSIVNISSLAGIRGTEKFPGFSSYVAAKHGVVGYTEGLAVEGKEHGIRVNCVAPGAVDTKMLHDAAPFLQTQTKPDDIAKVIFFLADESQSGRMTGSIIEVHSNE